MARKYTFSGPDSCLEELSTCVQDQLHLPTGTGGALRSQLGHLAPAAIRRIQQPMQMQGAQFQRMDGRAQNNGNILKDLAKISQFNLAR